MEFGKMVKELNGLKNLKKNLNKNMNNKVKKIKINDIS